MFQSKTIPFEVRKLRVFSKWNLSILIDLENARFCRFYVRDTQNMYTHTKQINHWKVKFFPILWCFIHFTKKKQCKDKLQWDRPYDPKLMNHFKPFLSFVRCLDRMLPFGLTFDSVSCTKLSSVSHCLCICNLRLRFDYHVSYVFPSLFAIAGFLFPISSHHVLCVMYICDLMYIIFMVPLWIGLTSFIIYWHLYNEFLAGLAIVA